MTEIRIAMADDLDGIRRVLREAYAPFLGTIPDLPDVTVVDESDLEATTTWVALVDDRISGVAMASSNGKIAHLANVAVAPNAAGNGLGRALIDTVVGWARSRSCSEIKLATHPDMGGNVSMYERLGWRVTDRSDRKVTLSRPL